MLYMKNVKQKGIQNYIIHPKTGEVQREEDYMIFIDWAGVEFIKLNAVEIISKNQALLKGTLENGKEVKLSMNLADYFDGKCYIFNK